MFSEVTLNTGELDHLWEEMMVQQDLNLVVEMLMVIVDKKLVLDMIDMIDMIVDEPLMFDEQLVQRMIADFRHSHPL
ncbi:hypothetical protein Tco_0658051 [Tanacetum coccineum]